MWFSAFQSIPQALACTNKVTPRAEPVVPKHKGEFARANLGHGDGAWKLSGTKAKA